MIKTLAKALTIVSHVPWNETGNIVLLRKHLSLIFSVQFLVRQCSLSSSRLGSWKKTSAIMGRKSLNFWHVTWSQIISLRIWLEFCMSPLIPCFFCCSPNLYYRKAKICCYFDATVVPCFSVGSLHRCHCRGNSRYNPGHFSLWFVFLFVCLCPWKSSFPNGRNSSPGLLLCNFCFDCVGSLM